MNLSDQNGEPEGLVTDPSDLLIQGAFETFVRNGAIVLQTHYPGWNWLIQAGEFAGMVNVFSEWLSVDGWGYQINVPREIRNTDHRAVWLKAGGEILERFGCPRGPFTASSLNNCKRHPITGKFIPHADDEGSKQSKRRADIDMRIANGAIKLIPAGGDRFIVEFQK